MPSWPISCDDSKPWGEDRNPQVAVVESRRDGEKGGNEGREWRVGQEREGTFHGGWDGGDGEGEQGGWVEGTSWGGE